MVDTASKADAPKILADSLNCALVAQQSLKGVAEMLLERAGWVRSEELEVHAQALAKNRRLAEELGARLEVLEESVTSKAKQSKKPASKARSTSR